MEKRSYQLMRVALIVASVLAMQTSPALMAESLITKRALLIGINEYKSDSLKDLRGCVNDIYLMESILVGKLDFKPENVKLLENENATRAAIISAIRAHLVAPSNSNDIVILHYSGHGSSMVDVSGDEVDGMDETIVPHDSRTPGVFDINDDEINGLMRELAEKTPHIVFIMDSCHSGSIARALETGSVARMVSADMRAPPAPAPFAVGNRDLVEGANEFRLPGADYVMISGSSANELSNETKFEGRWHGALTYYLNRALRSAGDRATYRDVMEQVKADVTARFRAQHPQLEGTGVDTVVFGVERILPQPYVLVEPNPDHSKAVTIQAGEVFGLVKGTRLKVFPAGTKNFNDPAGKSGEIRVTDVQATSSTAIIESGEVGANSRAVLDGIRPPAFKAGVFFEKNLSTELAAALEAELRNYEAVRIETDRQGAHIRVSQVNGVVRLEGQDLERLAQAVLSPVASDAQKARLIVGKIIHWAKWFSILAIDNPNPGLDIDLRIAREGAPEGEAAPEAIVHGNKATISVKNNSGQEIHVVILNLTSKGRVEVLYPEADIKEAISPNRSLTFSRPARIPDGSDHVVDWVKVIATRKPIAASVFKVEPLARSVAIDSGEMGGALEIFFKRFAQGRSRDLFEDESTTVEVDGWATTQRVLRVIRPMARIDGYVAHFDEPEDADRAGHRLAGTRSVCTAGTGTGCYEVTSIFDDETMREIKTPAVRSGDKAVRSIGQAFSKAYSIQRDMGAKRVEPLMDLRLEQAQTAPHRDDPETRDGKSDQDPRAEANPLWSLEYIRVPEAWEAVQAVTGGVVGDEAGNVVVAHIDTGYLKHPEIWSASGQGPVWPEMGYDYYDGDDDPTDEILDSGFLDHPVHGTGSGSAIVSPEGCQIPDAEKCPTGVARGARLVPIRINRSVVQFSTKLMSQAIIDASGKDRKRIKMESDVMSIAMGGLPSWSLWKAVKKAEKRGHLIIAAAGNYVKTVVWPARFRSTIAVSAVNAGCRPWKHASFGPSVDFSAPGESVWRATTDDEGKFITGMGTGTTYAASITAGVAALWIAGHKGTEAFERIRSDGQTTEVFRQLVKKSVWQPDAPNKPPAAQSDPDVKWRPFFFGDGIIDAAALLSADLSDGIGTRAEQAERVEDMPLWTSIYDQRTSLQVAQDDYRTLFGIDAEQELEEVAVYETEIMYHYTMNERVTLAVDRVIRGGRSALAYARVREILLAQDLSIELRNALKRQ